MVSTMQEHDAATKLKSAIVTILYRASYSGWREKWREVLQLWRSWPFGGSPTRLQTLTDTDQSRDCPQPRASGGDCFYSGESGHMVCRTCLRLLTDAKQSRECPRPRASGGGGGTCYNCGQAGHLASWSFNCTTSRSPRCFPSVKGLPRAAAGWTHRSRRRRRERCMGSKRESVTSSVGRTRRKPMGH